MKTKLAVGTRRLSTFDRVGAVIVAVLGTLAGLVAPGLHSIIPSPTPLLLFPGLLVGWPAAHLFGMTVGVLACGVPNGAACGFLLYAWHRLANAMAARIPIWFRGLAIWWLH